MKKFVIKPHNKCRKLILIDRKNKIQKDVEVLEDSYNFCGAEEEIKEITSSSDSLFDTDEEFFDSDNEKNDFPR